MGSSFGPGARPEPRSIWSLAFSADGQYLAAACRRMGGGQMLNGGGGRCWAIAPHASTDDVTLNVGTYAVTFAPAGTRFAVSRYHIVGFYDSPTKPEKLTYPLTPMWSNAIAFIPGSDFAVVGSNSFLYFMNAAKHEKPARVKTGSRTVAALSASPDGKTLIVGGRPGAVEVYDVATRALTTSYDFGIGGLHAIAFAPDGLTFAAAGDEGLVVCDAA
jgi:WD40 repeat protein